MFIDMQEYGKNSQQILNINLPIDEYEGDGIKRIKAYKCDLTYNDLQKLRNDFWNYQRENKRSWHIIRNACEADSFAAEQILMGAGFVCLEGNLKCVIDTNSEQVFIIPNFCINDPLNKSEEIDVNSIIDEVLNVIYIILLYQTF
jgi:hypothetical protein